MKELIIAAIIMLGIVLQGTVLPFLEIRGVRPDLLLTILVGMGLAGGNPVGLVVGLCAGLLVDVVYGQAVGLHALIYMLIGFGAGLFYKKQFMKHLMPLILTACACFAKNFVLFAYLFFRQVDFNGAAFWAQVVFPEMLYSLVFAYPVYFLMKWLFSKKMMERRIRGHWFDF